MDGEAKETEEKRRAQEVIVTRPGGPAPGDQAGIRRAPGVPQEAKLTQTRRHISRGRRMRNPKQPRGAPGLVSQADSRVLCHVDLRRNHTLSPPPCAIPTQTPSRLFSARLPALSAYPGSSHSVNGALPHHNDGMERMGENAGTYFSQRQFGWPLGPGEGSQEEGQTYSGGVKMRTGQAPSRNGKETTILYSSRDEDFQ